MDTRETTIYTAILISCFVIGIIIIYFVVSLVRKQQKNLELIRQNILTEFAAIEREQSRIAIDLHDDIGPILSVIKFQIDNVTVIGKDQIQLQKASEYIDNVIDKMREISNNLMPTSLLRKGLIASLKEFISSVETTSNIQFHLKSEESIEVAEEIRINIYRILKEVVHNSRKHSKATEIRISLSKQNGNLSIHYFDNGIGFNYQKALAESSGFGLRNLKSRVEVISGTMRVESKPNKGTAFLFEIPIH